MSFRLPIASREDVSATKRRKMTPNRALTIFEREKRVCCLCDKPIDGIRDDWFIEHPKSLGMGGSDKDEDLRPAHYACKPGKDAEDAAALAKARNVKKRDTGITQAFARPIVSAPFRKSTRAAARMPREPVKRVKDVFGRPCQ